MTCTKVQNQNMPTTNKNWKNKTIGKPDYFACNITFAQTLNTALKANVLLESAW